MTASIAAPVLANQALAASSAIFTWAVREELLPANPCKLVARNATRSRERVLSDSEVPQFWKAFEAAAVLIASSALKTILLTGQRPGEVAHMRREHIVDGGWWQMPGDPVPALGWPGTKNGASHRVWLPASVQTLIAELSDDDKPTGFVFATSRGRPVRNLDQAMRDITLKLSVEKATPHDLRRTHGSTITALGFGRDAMNRIQNHQRGRHQRRLRSPRLRRGEQARHGGSRGEHHGADRADRHRQRGTASVQALTFCLIYPSLCTD